MPDKPELFCGDFGGTGACRAYMPYPPPCSNSGRCAVTDDTKRTPTSHCCVAADWGYWPLICATVDAYRAATGQRPEAVTRVLGILRENPGYKDAESEGWLGLQAACGLIEAEWPAPAADKPPEQTEGGDG